MAERIRVFNLRSASSASSSSSRNGESSLNRNRTSDTRIFGLPSLFEAAHVTRPPGSAFARTIRRGAVAEGWSR